MRSAEPGARILSWSRLPARRLDERGFLPAALEIVETPASPAGRTIAGTIILFFAVAILWACLGTVDIIATAEGRIIPSGKTKLIQPFETGVVRAIHVHDGQVVQAGDVLIELDPTANAADEHRLEHDLLQDKLDIARLSALLSGKPENFAAPEGADPALVATARRQMEAQAAEQAAKVEALDRQIAQKRAEAAQAAETIAKIDAALPLLSQQRDIRKKLLENEFGSKLLYLQAEQQLVEQQHERLVQKQQREQAVEAMAALQQQRQEADAEYRNGLFADLAKAQMQANEHGEEALKAADRRKLQTLTAPVDGTVQQLAVHTVGGVVTPAQQLMVIVPQESRLEIEAMVANRDIGFVHEGQEAAIKIDTFTFTRYGLLHGEVLSVSQDAIARDKPQDRSGSSPQSGTESETSEPKGQELVYAAGCRSTARRWMSTASPSISRRGWR
jgi:hemolysin D